LAIFIPISNLYGNIVGCGFGAIKAVTTFHRKGVGFLFTAM